MGNAGSGKSTMAARLSADLRIPHLDLDSLAWQEVAVRRPIDESRAGRALGVSACLGA